MTNGMTGALHELDLKDWILQLAQMTPRMVVISSMRFRWSIKRVYQFSTRSGQSHNTKIPELTPVETVVEQTIQPGATTNSGKPVVPQRSIAGSVSEKEVTGLPQL
jgi:hypothetical protein